MRWALWICLAAVVAAHPGCATRRDNGATEPNVRRHHVEWPDVGGDRDDRPRRPIHQR